MVNGRSLLAIAPFAFALAADAAPAPEQPRVVGQITVHERLVVRVPARLIAPAPITYREHKGPRCVPVGEIGGALVVNATTVDFSLRGGSRVRARLAGQCPALDFYSGFYLRPGADGQICRARDAVHSRSGGACAIDRFRRLEVVAAR